MFGVLAVLLGPQLIQGAGPEDEEKGPSLLSRIPIRVKVATMAGGVGGALKGAAKSSGHILKKKIEEKTGG